MGLGLGDGLLPPTHGRQLRCYGMLLGLVGPQGLAELEERGS